MAAARSLLSTREYGTDVLCESCGLHVPYTRCRVISKTKGTLRCSNCGVRYTQLQRVFGSWPSEAFSMLPKVSLQ